LGYRVNTVYDLGTPVITDSIQLVSAIDEHDNILVKCDSGLSTNLYNYFLLCLDDYNQNHLNDGLVTISNIDNTVPLPSYAIRSEFTCNPITGQLEYNNVKGLTAVQIDSLNKIANSRTDGSSIGTSIPSSSYGDGPFVKDVFALIPIKTNGMNVGSTFVEYGGTLQNQERTYFGPVDIHRLSVRLITDRGDTVNLNRTNWSFSLLCEQLIKLNKRKKLSTVFRTNPDTLSIINGSGAFIDHKQYHTENRISNGNVLYNQIVPEGNVVLFDIRRNVSNCPTCIRTNHKLNDDAISNLPLNWNETKLLNENYQSNLKHCECTKKIDLSYFTYHRHFR
jgi:hypothetical protein